MKIDSFQRGICGGKDHCLRYSAFVSQKKCGSFKFEKNSQGAAFFERCLWTMVFC